jgi:hypothetical protein
MIIERNTKLEEKRKRVGTGEEENSAPIWDVVRRLDLFLVAPPSPRCLHREKRFGFEREDANLERGQGGCRFEFFFF